VQGLHETTVGVSQKMYIQCMYHLKASLLPSAHPREGLQHIKTPAKTLSNPDTTSLNPAPSDAQALRLGVRLAGSFLNNSSSRWETLAEPWAARLELIEYSSPIYRSDHQR
jgi:hypothetical protein